jgi:hypothetical protein
MKRIERTLHNTALCIFCEKCISLKYKGENVSSYRMTLLLQATTETTSIEVGIGGLY